jgi:acetolactate synthase-1/2/3 large subunit
MDKVNVKNGAKLLVECLELHGIKYIFAVPGAKIDPVFDALADGGPELVLCHHEQNAAFMAAAVGRLTGRPGVCLVTSGPGSANLVTGLATATSEGDSVIAISGTVSRAMRLKRTHQALDAALLMKQVTNLSVELEAPENIPETVCNAFRASSWGWGRGGATFISIPYDVQVEPVSVPAIHAPLPVYGPALDRAMAKAVVHISEAKFPVMLLGLNASWPPAALAIRRWLGKIPMPVVGTFQAAGVVPREMRHCFIGRVGLFNNQPGDRLLDKSDLVLAVGFDPVEYDPNVWNKKGLRKILHVDVNQSQIDNHYVPTVELTGDISRTMDGLASLIGPRSSSLSSEEIESLRLEQVKDSFRKTSPKPGRVHPLDLINGLRAMLDDDVTVICDVGSLYVWMGRYFESYEPRRLLFSNGQQTLGVALPWAIAASLVRPEKKIVSMSGDGGFLFSAMELETAVRLKSNLVHLVWRDGSYDMVKIQQMMKYGRESCVSFGDIDIIKFAESFGAVGMQISSKEQIVPVMKRALETAGPVLIDVPIDYSDNHALCEDLRADTQA